MTTVEQTYFLTQTICDSILILVYATTIYLSTINTKFKFVVTLLCLLLASNVAGLVVIEADTHVVKDDPVPVFWIITLSAFVFVRTATFNYAIWRFAYQYYTMFRNTPFLLKLQDPPEKMVSFD
jgi:hypothetical protein